MNLLLHLSDVAGVHDDGLVPVLEVLLFRLTIPLHFLVGLILCEFQRCRLFNSRWDFDAHESLPDQVLHQEFLPQFLRLAGFFHDSQFLHVDVCLDRDVRGNRVAV